ncbi:snaclec coagulation factor IX/factor X-binding protein subunit B-like [Sphaerodactylus townsendi]|uniref:snaclec coagulation factor IX/factor X-binding protein subunit B-like n=1 Tax=Sphaerodactylus townsendi TaxID=933632 RepID=UPI002026FDE3|nr:snaclec coagulation factor IX/factor X-binding protein subunit B-like [Sphaerodactylus townsendi]
MGPRTLCGLFLCHLIWLSCGSPVEVVEGIAPTDGPEDLNFLKAEYIQVRDTLCNNDWTPWGFYCYRYFDGPKSFSDAEGECQSYSRYGHLSSIHSSDHRAFIHGLVQNLEQYVWIGLQTLTGCDGWRWTKGSSYNPRIAYWAPGQPQNCHTSNHSCVQLTPDSKLLSWADGDCKITTGYICEIPVHSS